MDKTFYAIVRRDADGSFRIYDSTSRPKPTNLGAVKAVHATSYPTVQEAMAALPLLNWRKHGPKADDVSADGSNGECYLIIELSGGIPLDISRLAKGSKEKQ